MTRRKQIGWITTVVLVGLLVAGCAAIVPEGGSSQDELLQAAQQTLDALNAGLGNSGQATAPTSVHTEVPDDASSDTNSTQPSATDNAGTPPIIYEFDDERMVFDDGCWSIRQPMAEFGPGWNEDDHWFGENLNCEMGFELNIDQSGTYEVFLVATYAPDFGNLTLSFQRGIETDSFMNISLYNENIMPTDEIPLGHWHFNTGDTNRFSVKVYGKADPSSAYKFGLDYLKLIMVQADG